MSRGAPALPFNRSAPPAAHLWRRWHALGSALILSTLMLAVTLALILPGTLSAQPTPTATAQADPTSQRAALARATQQAETARKRGEALEARATQASAAADKARDQAAALAARIQQSEADLRAGEARLAIVAADQAAQARHLAQRQQPIARLVAALQQIARRSPVLALVEPGPVSDAVHRRILLAQALPVIARRTAGLRAELARSADLRRGEEIAAAQLTRTRATLLDQRNQLATAEQRLRVDARRFQETASAATERALAMGEQARDIGDLLGQIEVAGTVREALLRLPGPTLRPAAPASTALPTRSSIAADPANTPPAGWRLPVIGDIVTGFGERTESGLPASGLTVATLPAATVVAPAAGRVAFAGPFRGYGDILIIEHGGRWTSLIAGLGAATARVGESLRAGDPVGRAGPGQPRILIELRRDETAINPATIAARSP